MKHIGYFGEDNKKLNIYFDKENKKLYEEQRLIDLKYYAWALCNPWVKINYFQENNKHCWRSIIYDGLEIIIWGNTIEEMLNNVALIFQLYFNKKNI